MPILINGTGTISGVSDFSSSNITLTDPEITGGIFLGGTGSANYLDDYEEGTWTPQYGGRDGDPTIVYEEQYGYYTKIGSVVYFRLSLTTDTILARSGYCDSKKSPLYCRRRWRRRNDKLYK